MHKTMDLGENMIISITAITKTNNVYYALTICQVYVMSFSQINVFNLYNHPNGCYSIFLMSIASPKCFRNLSQRTTGMFMEL